MYVCIHACMHVCMHACMHGWMYACMYVSSAWSSASSPWSSASLSSLWSIILMHYIHYMSACANYVHGCALDAYMCVHELHLPHMCMHKEEHCMHAHLQSLFLCYHQSPCHWWNFSTNTCKNIPHKATQRQPKHERANGPNPNHSWRRQHKNKSSLFGGLTYQKTSDTISDVPDNFDQHHIPIMLLLPLPCDPPFTPLLITWFDFGWRP